MYCYSCRQMLYLMCVGVCMHRSNVCWASRRLENLDNVELLYVTTGTSISNAIWYVIMHAGKSRKTFLKATELIRSVISSLFEDALEFIKNVLTTRIWIIFKERMVAWERKNRFLSWKISFYFLLWFFQTTAESTSSLESSLF